ncbi:MAG: hypothetical protein KDE51_07740 [Anaerolineales bacterium]|nr:hypothetical protein [Anaerolineales bacterium]
MNPFLFVLITFPILYLLERGIHYHLIQTTHLLIGNRRGAFYLYAIILFPGVFLHELSHWLMANLLWVPTYNLSLKPELFDDGSYVLGYVESSTRSRSGRKVGAIRWSLIGVAPLLFGLSVILLIGFFVFDVSQLPAVSDAGFMATISPIIETNYFGIWLYVLFAVGNAMMPSKPDRQAWPTFFGILVVVLCFLYIMGVLESLWITAAPLFMVAFNYLGVAFTIIIIVNCIFLLAIMVLKRLLLLWRV